MLARSDQVDGIVLCAGGIHGLDEDKKYGGEKENVEAIGFVYGARRRQQCRQDASPGFGAMGQKARVKLTEWCKPIVQQELDSTGGSALPCEDWSRPEITSDRSFDAAHCIHYVRVPSLVATGKFRSSTRDISPRSNYPMSSTNVWQVFSPS